MTVMTSFAYHDPYLRAGAMEPAPWQISGSPVPQAYLMHRTALPTPSRPHLPEFSESELRSLGFRAVLHE